MIIKLYKSNISIGIILLPVIAIILCLPLLLGNQTPLNYNFEWQEFVFGYINQSKFLNFFLTLFILILNSTTIVTRFNQTTLFSKTTYLPAIIYLVLVSFSSTIQFSPALFIHFIFIQLIHQILKLDKAESALHVSFKSGLLIGLLSCFSLFYSILILAVFIPILLIHSINIKELVTGLLGLFIPILYLFSLQYIISDLPIGFTSPIENPLQQYQLIDYIKILSLSLITLLSFKMVNSFHTHNSLHIKKQVIALLICSALSVILSVILFFAYNLIDPIFITPFAFIITIASFSTKSDTFISFLLTITLIINIVALFLK